MNILIAAAVGAALPWLFSLIWAFIHWDFSWDRRERRQIARESVVFAVLVVVLMAVNGGLR